MTRPLFLLQRRTKKNKEKTEQKFIQKEKKEKKRISGKQCCCRNEFHNFFQLYSLFILNLFDKTKSISLLKTLIAQQHRFKESKGE